MGLFDRNLLLAYRGRHLVNFPSVKYTPRKKQPLLSSQDRFCEFLTSEWIRQFFENIISMGSHKEVIALTLLPQGVRFSKQNFANIRTVLLFEVLFCLFQYPFAFLLINSFCDYLQEFLTIFDNDFRYQVRDKICIIETCIIHFEGHLWTLYPFPDIIMDVIEEYGP